jgi:ribosome-associated toxin RatA of RatAB toxin-antitoxin module
LQRPKYATPEYKDAGGGWYGALAVHERQPERMCEVDVRTSLTRDQFMREYVTVRRPVLIRGMLTGASWASLRKNWSRAEIATSHPDVAFNTSTAPNAKMLDKHAAEVEMTLAECVIAR